MLANARQILALRSYSRRLGGLLVERYGYQKSYKLPQIAMTVRLHKLSEEFLEHAYVMFASEQEYVTGRREPPRAEKSRRDVPYRSRSKQRSDELAPAPERAQLRDQYRSLRQELARRYLPRGKRSWVPAAPGHDESFAPLYDSQYKFYG